MASFSHRPMPLPHCLRMPCTFQGRASRQCGRDGFQKPFDMAPLLVPRHANGKGDLQVTLGDSRKGRGRGKGGATKDALSALQGLTSHCSTPDGSLKCSGRSDQLLPWSMSVVWQTSCSANLASVEISCHSSDNSKIPLWSSTPTHNQRPQFH